MENEEEGGGPHEESGGDDDGDDEDLLPATPSTRGAHHHDQLHNLFLQQGSLQLVGDKRLRPLPRGVPKLLDEVLL